MWLSWWWPWVDAHTCVECAAILEARSLPSDLSRQIAAAACRRCERDLTEHLVAHMAQRRR